MENVPPDPTTTNFCSRACLPRPDMDVMVNLQRVIYEKTKVSIPLQVDASVQWRRIPSLISKVARGFIGSDDELSQRTFAAKDHRSTRPTYSMMNSLFFALCPSTSDLSGSDRAYLDGTLL